MINYTPQNQLSLSLFKHPFQQELDRGNRCVKLADLELANVYSRHLRNDAGRLSVDIRTVIAALIIKHKMNLDDRGTLKVDATVADQEVSYPKDLNLLHASREHLERIIDLLHITSEDGDKPERKPMDVILKTYW